MRPEIPPKFHVMRMNLLENFHAITEAEYVFNTTIEESRADKTANINNPLIHQHPSPRFNVLPFVCTVE